MAQVMGRRAAGMLLGAMGTAALAAPRAQARQVPEFWHYLGAPGEIEAVKALMAVANAKYPNTPITDRVIPGSSAGVRQQVQVSLMGGVPPTSFQLSAGYELRSTAATGRLVEVADVWKDVRGDEIFSEGLRRVLSLSGSAYGIPFGVGIISNVFYNKAVFERLKLSVPTSWDEFGEVCKALKAADIHPLTSAQGPSWTTYQFYGPLITVLGVEGCWEFIRGNVAFNGPEMLRAFRLFKERMASNFDPTWTGAKWSDGVDQMMRGRVGMYCVGDWASAYMKQRGWTPGKEYDLFYLPGLEKVSITQTDVAVVLKGEMTETGKNFLRAIATPEAQEAFAKIKGGTAPNSKTSPDIYDVLARRTFEKLGRTGDGYVTIPNPYLMLPTGFHIEFGTEVERFAAKLDEQALVASLNTLEQKRQQLKREDKFASF
ncbi:ABC transporter substrate-binding protein [Roseomonas sp. OT10]|uniref:ABC transporter substrate-binding protein n=1 Tax=Roseomonas cutis TaxID=2897332 RepID=UPI001E347651|nr:ABC transporter substrate-binding protein [Roseomonas sp. OT10]UFN48226.1 ABC transporter substrate-binding protein [Roseomonas sp. OT10]